MVDKKNSVGEGKKHWYCIDCKDKMIFPTRKGICFKCLKKQRDFNQKENNGLHDRKLSEFN